MHKNLMIRLCFAKCSITVLPRKERHASISEDDHFHENGLMILYQHAGIKRGMLFPEFFLLFLHFL